MRLKILSISKKYYINQYVMDFLDIMISLKNHGMSIPLWLLKNTFCIFWFFDINIKYLCKLFPYKFGCFISIFDFACKTITSTVGRLRVWQIQMVKWGERVQSYPMKYLNTSTSKVSLKWGYYLGSISYRQTTVPDFPSFPLHMRKQHVLLNLMVFLEIA